MYLRYNFYKGVHMTSKKESPVDLLIENILNTRFSDLSEDNVLNAKYRIIDVAGCAIAGALARGNEELVHLVTEMGGKPEATVVVHGTKIPAMNAAMVNSVMARSYDYEALGPLVEGRSIPAHISGTTVITALAMGELFEIDGKELVCALLAGDDFAVRVLAAEGSTGLPPGLDSVGTLNSFGAAAIAGRIMGLDKQQMKDAFGLVINQMSGTMQNIWDGAPAFKLIQGLSARNGIFSAQLAKTGWSGPDDPLTGRNGYFDLFTKGCSDSGILTRDLGKKYYHDAHFKPYSCCAVSHPAIDCALSLKNSHNIDTDTITEIVLYVPNGGLKSFLAQPLTIGRYPQLDCAFNYRYPVAAALEWGKVTPDCFSEDAIADRQVNSLTKKIRLEPIPGPDKGLLRAHLEIFTKIGQRFEVSCESPKGEPLENPLSRDEIIAKFMSNADLSKKITPEKAEKFIFLVENIEQMENIRELFLLLI